MRPDTGRVIVEIPATPALAEVGIRAVARIVLHSATKYLGGHGDVLGGVVACEEAFARQLRQVRFATGGVPHPPARYLLLRGPSTQPARMRAGISDRGRAGTAADRRAAGGAGCTSRSWAARWCPSRCTAIRMR